MLDKRSLFVVLSFLWLLFSCKEKAVSEYLTIEDGLPMAVATCGKNIYVVDGATNVVLQYDIRHQLKKTIQGFKQPMDVECDSEGKLYVADFGADMIVVLNPSGKRLQTWGSSGSLPGQFRAPAGLAIGNNSIYVAEFYNHRIQKFSLRGSFEKFIGKKGHGKGELFYPTDLVVDAQGYLHVADAYNHRLAIFKPDGSWFREYSKKRYRFDVPSGIAISSKGDYFIADSANFRVLKIDPKGKSSVVWQKTKGKTYSPTRISITGAANQANPNKLLVIDTAQHTIWELKP